MADQDSRMSLTIGSHVWSDPMAWTPAKLGISKTSTTTSLSAGRCRAHSWCLSSNALPKWLVMGYGGELWALQIEPDSLEEGPEYIEERILQEIAETIDRYVQEIWNPTTWNTQKTTIHLRRMLIHISILSYSPNAAWTSGCGKKRV